MARLRDRVSEIAETRGELVLYKSDRPTDVLCALRGALHHPVDRGAGRGLDPVVVQGMLPRDASLIEVVISADASRALPAGRSGSATGRRAPELHLAAGVR